MSFVRSPSVHSTLVGGTQIVPLRFRTEDITLLAKCEFTNPSGSIKDRFASAVVEDAEERGLLGPGSIILECSSGNTGVALAMVGAERGYPVEIVLSAHASKERQMLIRRFGGKVILFDGSRGYRSGIELTRQMAAANPRYFLPRQFENLLNALDHEERTGAEILTQVRGRLDAFVTGYGTGGTLAGVSRALRRRHPHVRIYAMEPAEAALLLGEAPCCHQIEGIADGFIPDLLRTATLDGSIKVSSADALAMARRLMREYGLPVGTSSGANVVAGLEIARELPKGAVVVTLLCDRAERYFSTPLFAEEDAG